MPYSYDDKLPHFTLSPAQLSKALVDGLDMEGSHDNHSLTNGQQLYARATLLNISSISTGIMAEEASLYGSTPARFMSPAYSMARVGQYEEALYDLVEKGDKEGVKATTQHQTITTTAHPNFSRNRDLVKKGQELTNALIGLDKQAQDSILKNGTLPYSRLSDKIKMILLQMKPLLAPRTKRSRREELEESVLDFIPTAMNAASEQVEIFKQRKSYYHRIPISNYSRVEDGKKSLVDERHLQQQQHATEGTALQWEFDDVKQLDAMAALLPEFNTWFPDGDGKRSSHVYDAEVAIPAIKKATYQHYLELLKALPADIGDLDVDHWKYQLEHSIHILQDVEDLAADRMDKLNAMQKIAAEHTSSDVDARETALKDSIIAAQESSGKYLKTLRNDEVKEALKKDYATELKTTLGAALGSIYSSGDNKLGWKVRKTAESLYMKLSAYGNFAVKLQRRENAKEYREVFRYMIENDRSLRAALAEHLEIDEKIISAKLKRDQEIFSEAVAFVAKSATDPKDPLKIRSIINEHFLELAGKIEKAINLNGDAKPNDLVIDPLERRQLLALDDLGYFHMARHYPEAFKGGFVVAEFAQPSESLLREGNSDKVKEEVTRYAKADMELQLIYANAMGVPNVPIMPLFEDPASMRYAPDAVAALREGPMQEYLLNFIGINGPDAAEVAEGKALKRFKDAKTTYIKRDGNEEESKIVTSECVNLTAYENLQRYGCTDAELIEKKFTAEQIAALKNTYVLEGPPDMEACSDNSKRATIIGAELAEQSVREKAIEATRHPVTVGGKNYVIVKPKYYGQGGSIGRATESPIDTVQVTLQGEHALPHVPKSLAHKMVSYLLGRLYLTNEAARGETPSRKLFEAAADIPGHAGNKLGLPGYGMTENDKELMHHVIDTHVDSTRDDPRFDIYMAKYGDPTVNHSARPNAKKTGAASKPITFSEERAIGVFQRLRPMPANVLGLANLLDSGTLGDAKGEPHPLNIQQLRNWKQQDPSFQQRLTAAALMTIYANPEKKWLSGGIIYNRADGTLTKGDKTISLEELAKAYGNKETTEYNGFTSDDLVMAHLTRQYRQLEKGLLKVYNGKSNLIDIFPKAYHGDINILKELSDEVLTKLGETSVAPGTKDEDKSADRKLYEGTHHLLFESGSGIFPMPALLEKHMYLERKPPENGIAA